ncbi:MAG: ATP/GTP-binding protein [Hyphomicrobiales bacterium]|nr:MAG: ATP/GTP-binding protein [Hyphomicrobiales bacterium]
MVMSGSRIALAVFGVLVSVMLLGMPQASAETRTLHLYNTHTHERTAITFKKNGRYVASGLRQLNRFLRDWRRNESIKMDPELFDLIWEVYQKTGVNKDIHVVSGYRSPATNNMLRKRSRGVAKFSQHTLGKAMDFFIPGYDSYKIRVIGLRQQVGGVGYYPRSRSRFIHLDTGRVRHWPRMTRSQLVKVFPRGETLHVPSDGKPLQGYSTALARAKSGKRARTATVVASASSSRSAARYTSGDDDIVRQKGSGKGFLSALFGGGRDEEEDSIQPEESAGPVPPATVASPSKAVADTLPGLEQTPTPAAAPEPAPEPAQETLVASGPAPKPRSKPLALLASAETTPQVEGGEAIIAMVPRNKPVFQQIASALPPADDATASIPSDKPTIDTNAAAVLGYGPAVPTTKPNSVLDATRQFAAVDSATDVPSPRDRPQRLAARAESGLPSGKSDRQMVANTDAVGSISGSRLRSRLFVDAKTTRTMSFANFSHPDQHSLAVLMAKPNRALANGFVPETADESLQSTVFTGSAIGTLTVVRLY